MLFQRFLIARWKVIVLDYSRKFLPIVVPRNEVLCLPEVVGPLDEDAKAVRSPHAPLRLHPRLLIPGHYLQQTLFCQMFQKAKSF